MTRHLCLSLAATVMAGGLACLPLAGAMASAEVSKAAMSDVDAARTALAKGNSAAAMERVEHAETTLLNAKQAGDETAPNALNALQDAHKGLVDKNRRGAKAALDSAANDLRS
jgi:hypothetical protein